MKWFTEFPKHQERRTITKFLIFPLSIGCETRWLEKVKIIQQYRRRKYPYEKTGWINVRFKQ